MSSSKHKGNRGRVLTIDLGDIGPICSSGKRGFATEERAKAELRKARHYRWQDRHGGRTPGRTEKSYYECHVCHHYHLRCNETPQRRSSYDWQQGRRN